jgi:hypothetical protein
MFGFDAESGKFIATLGVGGILAAFMFLFYRRDVQIYTNLWKGQSEQLTQVVKENTAAITRNTVIIEALHRRDDRIEEVLESMRPCPAWRCASPQEAVNRSPSLKKVDAVALVISTGAC